MYSVIHVERDVLIHGAVCICFTDVLGSLSRKEISISVVPD